jgi:predicted aspartyl protease
VHYQSGQDTSRTRQLPATIWFRESKARGLLADVWINGRGPYLFAIDTGAGITVISQQLASAAGLRMLRGRTTVVAGLSGREVVAGETMVDRLAIGNAGNAMASKVRALVMTQMPEGIDGILDPTDAYAPFGYTIDFANRHIRAFDPRVEGLSARRQPVDGAVVSWLRFGQSDRPFVKLGDGRLALIDSGSGFGLAISESRAIVRDHARRSSTDIGGGMIRSTRIQPTTVSIGALELSGVPTDILSGVEKGAPIILGRDALYPFRVSFDPSHRLIEIAPSVHDNR